MTKTWNELLPLVASVTRNVGQYILKEGQDFDRRHIEYKGTNNLVSYVDKEAEKKLVAELSNLLPEAGFITEEDTVEQKEKELMWVIDPIDGTTNFLHNLPVFSVSVGLLRHKKPVLGVIYDPSRDESFTATVDAPAALNGEPIQVSPVQDLGHSLMATGFPYYNFEKMQQYLDIIAGFMQHSHGLRRMGSAAIDLAYVACGRFEGFFEYNLKPWDVAAGVLIVKQAGGIVTDFSNGENYIFGKELIAGCAAQPQMLKIIQDRWNS